MRDFETHRWQLTLFGATKKRCTEMQLGMSQDEAAKLAENANRDSSHLLIAVVGVHRPLKCVKTSFNQF